MFQTWQEKEAGKVVLYTTTMGIVRGTYQRCLQVRQILRTHLVKFVERDVFMSREVQKEIRERLGADTISVPQLFVEGNLIGVSYHNVYFSTVNIRTHTHTRICKYTTCLYLPDVQLCVCVCEI